MNDKPEAGRLLGRPFAKMNGIGNAILVLDLRGDDHIVTPAEARALARRPDLAFDQLMAIHDPAEHDPANQDFANQGPASTRTDAFVRIYNADGSEAGACGNGTRCVAWYLLRDRAGATLTLGTRAGALACARRDDGSFAVDMGSPALRWNDIPLRDASIPPEAVDVGAPAPGPGFAVSMGNPHVVYFVPDTDALDLARIGPPIETAPAFPERVNVSFAQILDRTHIKLRVWERGAGATRACGTGACATLVAAAATGRTARQAAVDLPGGTLSIEWRDDGHVIMGGAVELEHEGVLTSPLPADAAA